jgi:hypothetical protein
MNSPELIQTALRVLAAISSHEEPLPRDVAALRNVAPAYGYDAADDLACYVVETELKTRAAKGVGFEEIAGISQGDALSRSSDGKNPGALMWNELDR